MKNAISIVLISSCFLSWGAVEPDSVFAEEETPVDVALPYRTVCHLLSESYPAGKRRDYNPKVVPYIMTLVNVNHEKTDQHFCVFLTLARTDAKSLAEMSRTGLGHHVLFVEMRVTPRDNGEAARFQVSAERQPRNGLGMNWGFRRSVDVAPIMKHCRAWIEFQAALYCEPR